METFWAVCGLMKVGAVMGMGSQRNLGNYIMVYAFVIHICLVPGLRGKFAFNLSAIIAYGSILMTYFGVNFYLSGLHSYASGDQIMSVKFIGITCFLILVLAFCFSQV